MKKIFKYLLTIIFSFGLVCNSVFAADYSISVTSNSVTVGNTVTLKINSGGLTGRFDVSSSNSSVASLSNSYVWLENNTQSITISAKKAGTAVITVTPDPGGVSDANGNEPKLSVKKITITVKEKTVSKPSSSSSSSNTASKAKSSNSYLSSLTIDGYELDSEFSKEMLEYSVTVKEGTEKIKINAQLADSSAKVSGIGEVSVTEGINIFNIVVTAENGSKRTYVLKVLVKEYKPIEVKVDNSNYTVVRKRKDLPVISDYFTEKDITIGDETIEGYVNEELGYQVVGLKDSKGDIKYYIYKNNKYELYNEQVFNGMVLRILDKELDGEYKKTSFSYNDIKIDSYQEVSTDIIKDTYAVEENSTVKGYDFYLFYAINMETGKEELYQYDSVEKTVQRYNSLMLDIYKEQANRYYLYLLYSILTLGVVVILFSIIFIFGKRKRKNNRKKRNINNKKKDIDIEDDL